MDDVFMQLDNFFADGMDDAERRPVTFHDAVASQAPSTEEGDKHLDELRARVLAGAYDSLEIADRVARAILRDGAFSRPPSE